MDSVYRAPGTIILGVSYYFQQRGIPYRWELQGPNAALSGQPVGTPVSIGMGAQVQMYRDERLGAYGVLRAESGQTRLFLLRDQNGRRIPDPRLFLEQLRDPQSNVSQAVESFIKVNLEAEKNPIRAIESPIGNKQPKPPEPDLQWE